VAHFPDLSPYTYFPNEDAETLNVGWLDARVAFPTGETPPEFHARLFLLCQRRVNQTRGAHFCPLCIGVRRKDRAWASAEMRVRSETTAYAAPTLIHHYVVVHNYKPPEAFIEAVLAWEDVND
jgi:hypothetical protein